MLNSDLWVESICNSTYFESVLNVKVPTMTSNTTPIGKCICDGHILNNDTNMSAWAAFNDDDYSHYEHNNSIRWATPDKISVGSWCGYTFTEPVVINKVRIFPCYYYGELLKDFIIQGSNDEFTNDIHNLYEDTFPNIEGLIKDYILGNHNSYSSYRIYVTSDSHSTVTVAISIVQIQFYGRQK